TSPQWGKMNVAQMMAHCNVPYDMTYGEYPQRNFLMKFMLKTFLKSSVCGEKPYPKNGRTAPEFIIADKRDFEKEKARLIVNINKVADEGEAAFEGRENISFGKMTAREWSNLFSKHLDHHFTQFGV
ncbi:MAG: DUF1569 domain-containing protein, partial [Chitinophagales bacterium]